MILGHPCSAQTVSRVCATIISAKKERVESGREKFEMLSQLKRGSANNHSAKTFPLKQQLESKEASLPLDEENPKQLAVQ